MNRRDFLKFSLAGLASPFLFGFNADKLLAKAYAADRSVLALAEGGKMEDRIKRVLKPLGGIERFVQKGSRVVLKPNAAWATRPGEGANTNPELVYHLARLCFKAGARQVNIYEHTCDHYRLTFKLTGIQEAIEKAGGKIYSAHQDGMYETIAVPKGKILKSCQVIKPLLDADCYINIPVAKVHSATTLSLGLKNQMGIVLDRGFWHVSGLNQAIADFATRIVPRLNIQLLLTNGPKGPGKITVKNTLVAGTDVASLDAFGATFFNLNPLQVEHIRLAGQMGVGEIDLKKIAVEKAGI